MTSSTNERSGIGGPAVASQAAAWPRSPGVGDPSTSPGTSTTGPVGRGARAVGCLVLTAGISCAVGIEAATPDGSGLLQPSDDAIARASRSIELRPLATLLRPIGLLDRVGVAAIVALVVVALVGRRPSRRSFAGPLAVAALAAEAVAAITQHLVGRPGPRAGAAAIAASTTSFPGTAVAVAAAMATTALALAARDHRFGRLSSRTRALAIAAPVALALIAIVGGVHWLSDELAAGVVGAVVGAIVTGAIAPTGRRYRSRFATRLGLAALLITVPPASVSYWGALRAPGYAATDARTVDWLRTHGLGSVVDRAESWWLWTNLPSTTDTINALPAAPLPERAAPTGSPSATPGAAPLDVVPLISPPLFGEGRWSVAQAGAGGVVQIATTSIRPDPVHPALVATLAWMNTSTVRYSLVAGTREPAGKAGAWGATVPPDLRATLLAAFNSGYKMHDTPGGAVEEGLHAHQLKAGVASFVVRADGSATVGAWGRDVSMSTDVVAVRQNLHLIVDHGQLVVGLRTNVGQQWGTVKNALPTWRSGLGVDRGGNLVYASGNQLTIDTLAVALQRAGAVTAMELDIHNHMVTYNLFTRPAGTQELVGHKLSPDMTEPATRYLRPDQRDFIAVFSR
ncbi:MAG: hypothetical protein JWM12_2493 [Ilumatobacteraceae bacterium]|nr:hypothetical protein [Ilumatobacteraceae bacterium]